VNYLGKKRERGGRNLRPHSVYSMLKCRNSKNGKVQRSKTRPRSPGVVTWRRDEVRRLGSCTLKTEAVQKTCEE